MATPQERLRLEQEKLRKAENLLAAAKQTAGIQGLETTPAIEKASKQVEASKKRIAEIRKVITGAAAEAREEKKTAKEKQIENENAARESLPFDVNDKLWNGLKSIVGPNLSPEAFGQAGVGAGIFVYQGQRKGTTTSPTGGTYTTKVDNVALSNDVVNSFWTDKTIQKKVLNALIASGNSNATQLQAFATWQSVVQQSAQLYNAGKGPKFSPMDILDMSITKAGGVKPDVTTYIDVPRDNELKQKLKGLVFNYIQKEPGDDDPIFNKIFNEVKELYQKGTTTTTITDAKTGKRTTTTKGEVTDATVQAKIKKYYDENNQDFLEAKSLEGADYFSTWMRG